VKRHPLRAALLRLPDHLAESRLGVLKSPTTGSCTRCGLSGGCPFGPDREL
jgi:hypothetical protein